SFYVDHSHCLVLAPATLAALPSTRAIPDRDVFYVAHPIRSIREQAVQLRMESIRLVDAAAFGATDNVWRTKCVLFRCRVLADR
ncbi:MAG TPA: hypothetical protein VK562_03530, partial [Candidatus Acidoferrum sp.]|nr:hypothetical protein [Candidatus Acidoferrum sp.]